MMAEPSQAAPAARISRTLFDLIPETLGQLFDSWGEPGYRAAQLLEWVYQHGAVRYDEMSNLPKMLRARLARELAVYESTVVRERESADGTAKLLLRWPDGATSECVLIPEPVRKTACVSTQVGCGIGCAFCASGVGGFQRNLSCGQIVEQAMRIRRRCADAARLSNVVFMGLGEPLANYDATVRAVRTINAAWGMGVGARKITISTVGLPSQMRRLADEQMQITLALSLHAPTDELRERIIPRAQRVGVEALVEAGRYYFERTGREVTLEYVLLAGLNDGTDQARQLAGIAGRMRGHVNLIPYNPVQGLPYERTPDEVAKRFLDVLRKRGVNAHLRRSRGLDIDAACGQLRRRDHAVGPAEDEADS